MSEPRQKPGRSKQDYGTPPEFLEAVKGRLEIPFFDCDLAASPENAVAGRYYTKAENSLLHPWTCGRGWNWLNPPFTNIGAWVNKANISSTLFGARTAMLVPAAVGANWWRDFVHERASVLFINGRLTFVGCSDPYPKDCALLLYAPPSRDGCDPPSYDVWTWKQGKSVARREVS
jgi:phage N-6-adenine-methyltransferase